MKDVDICDGMYASHWGLTDFYPKSEAALKLLLASGEDFDTDWFGCKKEIRYARIRRDAKMGDDSAIIVDVAAHMDDLWEGNELIYDALWEVSKQEEELPEDIVESIFDVAIDCGIDDRAEETEFLPISATYEDIVAAIGKLESVTERRNEENFARLCDIVRDHVEYMNSGEYRKPESKEESD